MHEEARTSGECTPVADDGCQTNPATPRESCDGELVIKFPSDLWVLSMLPQATMTPKNANRACSVQETTEVTEPTRKRLKSKREFHITSNNTCATTPTGRRLRKIRHRRHTNECASSTCKEPQTQHSQTEPDASTPQQSDSSPAEMCNDPDGCTDAAPTSFQMQTRDDAVQLMSHYTREEKMRRNTVSGLVVSLSMSNDLRLRLYRKMMRACVRHELTCDVLFLAKHIMEQYLERTLVNEITKTGGNPDITLFDAEWWDSKSKRRRHDRRMLVCAVMSIAAKMEHRRSDVVLVVRDLAKRNGIKQHRLVKTELSILGTIRYNINIPKLPAFVRSLSVLVVDDAAKSASLAEEALFIATAVCGNPILTGMNQSYLAAAAVTSASRFGCVDTDAACDLCCATLAVDRESCIAMASALSLASAMVSEYDADMARRITVFTLTNA